MGRLGEWQKTKRTQKVVLCWERTHFSCRSLPAARRSRPLPTPRPAAHILPPLYLRDDKSAVKLKISKPERQFTRPENLFSQFTQNLASRHAVFDPFGRDNKTATIQTNQEFRCSGNSRRDKVGAHMKFFGDRHAQRLQTLQRKKLTCLRFI